MTPNIVPCFLTWCRAYWEQRLEAAVQAENEACAKVADNPGASNYGYHGADLPSRIAKVIRARTAQDEGE